MRLAWSASTATRYWNTTVWTTWKKVPSSCRLTTLADGPNTSTFLFGGSEMLTRRQMIAAALAAPTLRAQIAYRDYARCLPDYLAVLAGDAYARRNQRIAAMNTAAAIRDYQAWARSTFGKLIGVLPERSALHTRTVGAFERERYRVEYLVYESRPGLFVTANLYLPKG